MELVDLYNCLFFYPKNKKYPNNYFLSDIKISTIVETTRRDDFRLLDYEQQYFREIERYCKDTHGIEIHIDLPFIELNTGNWWYDVENEE